MNGHTKIVQILLENGADTRGKCLLYGSVSDLALSGGHIETSDILLGATIETTIEE